MRLKNLLSFVFIISLIIPVLSQEQPEIKPISYSNKNGTILSLAFQPDSKALVIGTEDKRCIFWSFADNKEILSIPGLMAGVKALGYTADSKYLITAIERGIKLFYPNGEFVNQHGGPATFIWSFSVNLATNKVAFGSYDKNIRVIDFTSGKLTTVTGHTKNVLAVCYSPDNKLLASGSLDQTVRLWDASSFNPVATLTGHGGNIYQVLFSPDSKKLFSASDDNSIKIWDVESLKLDKSLLGNTKAVLCIAVSPDGSYLVSGSFDGFLKLWDIVRGEQIFSYKAHTDAINAVSYSSDGKYIASGSADKTASVWEVKPVIFVKKYFARELNDEKEKSGLFAPKSKDENKDTYKARLEKANAFEQELITKYYNQYLTDIKGQPVK